MTIVASACTSRANAPTNGYRADCQSIVPAQTVVLLEGELQGPQAYLPQKSNSCDINYFYLDNGCQNCHATVYHPTVAI